MFKVVSHPDVPPDRAYVFGAPAKLSNFKVKCEENADGSITVKTTCDVEYEPIYTAVIRLDP